MNVICIHIHKILALQLIFVSIFVHTKYIYIYLPHPWPFELSSQQSKYWNTKTIEGSSMSIAARQPRHMNRSMSTTLLPKLALSIATGLQYQSCNHPLNTPFAPCVLSYSFLTLLPLPNLIPLYLYIKMLCIDLIVFVITG